PAAALEFFPGEGLSIAEVLLEIELDRVLLDVVLLQWRPQAADRAAHVDAGVLLDRIEPGAAAPEELEQDLAAVPPEAQRLAAEDLPATDVEALLAHGVRPGEQGRDLLPELRRHRLVGLQDQHPVVAQGEVVEPPLEDPGDDPAVVVGQ